MLVAAARRLLWRRAARSRLVLTGASALLGSGAAAEDVVGEGLRHGNGVVGGEKEAKNQEVFDRDEPPSF